MGRFDIRRQVREADTDIGGFAITSTAIETRFMDLQHLRGDDALKLGGLASEAQFHAFTNKETDILEQDILTDDSGTTKFQVIFVDNLWPTHIEIFAKRIV